MSEEKKYTEQDFHKALFMNLVMMLASSAMQQMGKIVNPITNKMEINMEGAQLTIDMLVMLQKKTMGNLDDEEKGLLNQTVSSLQLTYVETNKDSNTTSADAKQQNEQPKTDSVNSEDKKKFHKSYGE